VLQRGELTFSLQTTSAAIAEERALEMGAAQLRLCRAVLQAGPMTADQVEQLVNHYMTSFRRNREEDAVNSGQRSPVAAEVHRVWTAEELRAAEDDLLHHRLEATERLAVDLLRETGQTFADIGEDAFRRLCFRLLNARVDVMREEAKRLPGGGTAGAPVVAPAGKPTPLLSALVADYLTFRDASDPLPPNTRTELVAALKALGSLMGDPPLGEVRNKDAQDFARRFSQLPARWRSKHKGKSAAEVLAETEGMNMPRVEPGTVKKELALIKAFWRWAVTREELTRNVMDAVTPPDTGSKKDKRRPFADAEIANLRPFIEAQRERRPERYWVALLCAFHGARLEEMAQLRKADVVQVEGIPCLRVRGDAGSVKNAASERDLPIHSRLIELGFLKYVKAAKGTRLFGDDERDAKVGAPISKWFAYELNKLNLSERSKKGLHSFRHTMRDKLRLAGVDPVTRREILGHAHDDVEDQVYGNPTGIKERREALEKVRLPL
jgi:integrase